MIVSLHLPKTAGNTFRDSLDTYFGKRLYQDYGDWIGDESAEAQAHRKTRLDELLPSLAALVSETQCIHGHFYASKWVSLLGNPRFFSVFRDPFETIPSLYHFLLRNPDIPQPFVRRVHETKMTLSEMITHPGRDNLVSRVIAPLSIDDFEVIGLSSDMKRTAALFNKAFDTRVELPEQRLNENPEGSEYALSAQERRLIEQYNAKDLELWNQAVRRFSADIRCLTDT